MIDLALLRQEIACAIEDGIKNGAEHIAAAMARPAKENVQFATIRGVKVDEILDALKVLVESNTIVHEDGVMIVRRAHAPVGQQIEAWTTLRKALGMPT